MPNDLPEVATSTSIAYLIAIIMIVWRVIEKVFVGRYLDHARQDAVRRASWEENMEGLVHSIDLRLSRLEGRTQERDRFGARITRPGDHQ